MLESQRAFSAVEPMCHVAICRHAGHRDQTADRLLADQKQPLLFDRSAKNQPVAGRVIDSHVTKAPCLFHDAGTSVSVAFFV